MTHAVLAMSLDAGKANSIGCALVDRSRAPVHPPHTTREEVIEAFVALRKRFPQYKPGRKIRVVLAASTPQVHWPAPSAIGDFPQGAWLRHFVFNPSTVDSDRDGPC